MNTLMNELPKMMSMINKCDDAYIEVQDWNNLSDGKIIVFKEKFTTDAVTNFRNFIKNYGRKADKMVADVENGVFKLKIFIAC